ncbi:hydroxyacylglutathione hydrolase [Nitzschia inconspicua]|uniref:Hydroxyacylglutathione hydrolase n=1 Tax=Nitzschia inconspicua TaxID=303405 RepID=A0A9K3PNC0_9STRA|nr:hydroxyacylglutathione hydrolase [Nitzschia inconspicua]
MADSSHPPDGTVSPQHRNNEALASHNDDDDNHDNDRFFFLGSELREFRHNPCLMRPVSLVMIVIFGAFTMITLLLQVPALVLGLVLSPILQRSSWYVEFLYPLPVGRWAHFFLMGLSSKMKLKAMDKNRGFHSRTLEQRYEVVKDRVYIHPLPQWIDNVGYLIVCLPEPMTTSTQNSTIRVEDRKDPILALLIDCGETDAVVRAVEMIQEFHYGNKSIQLQSILSTHKHHDHTGANEELLAHDMGKTIRHIFGGAVERVPGCTDPLADGDVVDLPKCEGNDMNELVEIEVICVPAHTRGSVVYRLKSKSEEHPVDYMFTGDTIFSGGGGVSFEADSGIDSEKKLAKSNGNTFIRGTSQSMAMDRCFSEVLARSMPEDRSADALDRILIFPGHDYTQELLSRQFQGMGGEASKWKNFPPGDFFETASHLYLSIHRKSLPHNSGRLLMVPSSLSREIRINTQFRSLRRSAELVVRAIEFWHDKFCKHKVDEATLMNGFEDSTIKSQHRMGVKTPSQSKKWNLNATIVNKKVFTTVYTEDLENLVNALSNGDISKAEALEQIQLLDDKLDQPVVNKRAIPGFLPSDKNIYRGICGLTILGSKPAALTISDSRRLNMPPPVDANSDKILVSEQRLIRVLGRLGMLRTLDGNDVSAMIRRLWEEANEYCSPRRDDNDGDEERAHWHDELEIGMLKWIMYGVSANQPSWFSKMFCMPCSNHPGSSLVFPDHLASKMNQKSGDLVSHDILACYLCRNVTGYEGKFETRSSTSRIGFETRPSYSNHVVLNAETVSDESLQGGIDPPAGTAGESRPAFLQETAN